MPLFRFNCLFFVLLAIATLLAHFFIERFQPTGSELLTDQWQTRTSDKSRIDIEQGYIRIFSDDPHEKASAFQFLQAIPHHQLVLFSAEMKSDGIIQGIKQWHTGRISIMHKIDDKSTQLLPLSATSLIGSNEWKKYQNHFLIPPKLAVLFSVEIYNTVGSLEVKNIHFYPVKELQIYIWSKNIILLSWGIFFVLLIGSCYFAEQKSIALQFLFIIFFALIVAGTSMQVDIKELILNAIDSQFSNTNIFTFSINELPWDISKIGHFIFFLGLGYVLQLIIRHKKISEIFTVIAMLACGTELVQIYIDGRTPHISDVFIDLTGGTLGIVLARLFRKIL